MSAMVRATSTKALSEARARAGDGYRSNFVFAYRSFQLKRNAVNAERLLALIPKDDAQQAIVMTLGDSLCNEEPITDMEVLSRVAEGFARELASAVLLARSYLRIYVAYGMQATLDPHSDYAIQMQRVCRLAHRDFLHAIEQLPKDERQQLSLHVLNPNTCRAIALPESE